MALSRQAEPPVGGVGAGPIGSAWRRRDAPEVGFRVGLASAGDFRLNRSTGMQPGHDAQAGPDHAVTLEFHRRFGRRVENARGAPAAQSRFAVAQSASRRSVVKPPAASR